MSDMTLAGIRRRVDGVAALADDDERAHAAEDALRREFIRHVAHNGPKRLAELAREVLRTEDMPFDRWCA